MDKEGNKTGGRIKGTPNKTTGQLKSLVNDFISENWAQVQKDFKSKRLHPRDRLFFVEKLLKYSVPIMGSTNTSLEIKKQLESLSDADLDKVVNMVLQQAPGDQEGTGNGENEE